MDVGGCRERPWLCCFGDFVWSCQMLSYFVGLRRTSSSFTMMSHIQTVTDIPPDPKNSAASANPQSEP
jgi:hypothetical protein